MTSPPRSRNASAPRCSARCPPPWPRRKPKLKPERGDGTGQARSTALDLLARREHSEQELARKLATRGYSDEVIESTLDTLAAQGLLSNARYAESFIHSRFQRGQGPQKIRAELRERGVDDALIEAGLDVYTPHWQELIEQVRRKRFGSERPADFRERSRQMRFLAQRGFTVEQIDALFRVSD